MASLQRQFVNRSSSTVDRPTNADNYEDVRLTTMHIVAKTLALDPAVVPASAQFLVQAAKERNRIAVTPALSPAETHKHVDGLDKGKGLAASYEAAGYDLVDDAFERTRSSASLNLVDPDDFVLYSTDEASRISYAIAVAFDVELDKEVVLSAANVGKLASRINEARKLRPGDAGTGMKADLREG